MKDETASYLEDLAVVLRRLTALKQRKLEAFKAFLEERAGVWASAFAF